MSEGDGYETVDAEVGDISGYRGRRRIHLKISTISRAQGVIRRVGLEGLVWWEGGLRWLQGQGGERGAL